MIGKLKAGKEKFYLEKNNNHLLDNQLRLKL